MKNILVTGGAGFIGSHVVERLLERGDKVTVIDNLDPFYDPRIKRLTLEEIKEAQGTDRLTFLQWDITRPHHLYDALTLMGPFDVVVHLAARADVRTNDFLAHEEVNTRATIRLMQMMAQTGHKNLVLASTSAIYGDDPYTPSKELEWDHFPLNAYAASKKSAELYAYGFHHSYGMNVFALRYFTVVGKRQRPDMALALFTSSIAEGRPITIYGDGSMVRDLTHVDDIVEGTIAAIDAVGRPYPEDRGGDIPRYEIINLGSGKATTLGDFVEMIGDELGDSPLIEHLPKPTQDIQVLQADISKARELLGYEPKRSLQAAIRDYVEWYDRLRTKLDK